MRNTLWKNALVFGIILLLLRTNVVSGYDTNSLDTPSSMDRGWLYVGGTGPGNYTMIQDAIDNASDDDTIFVYEGTYHENIVISKKGLFLKGENKFTTRLDIENSTGDAVFISANDITFEGFTVTNARCKDEYIWNQSGIVISSSNVTIKDNIISNNQWGLVSYVTASNLTICDNMFFYDGFLPGCYIIWSNGYYNCTDNIPLESVLLNVYNNTVNSKPLYYYKNIHDTIVNPDAGQVILVNCTNITVRDLSLINIDFSVMLYYCSNCTVENSTIKNADGELILFFSENNTIQHNTIVNAFHGVCLDIGSKNNNICYNTIQENLQGISVLTGCTGNSIYQNEFNKNSYAMEITSYIQNIPSHDNYIYENSFYKNTYGMVISFKFNDPLCYTINNTISNNIFLKNGWGIFIKRSEGNVVKNNTFKGNILSAYFCSCSQNVWDDNYWGRSRMFPKLIFGYKLLNDKIPIPWINIDKHPAQEPYEIP